MTRAESIEEPKYDVNYNIDVDIYSKSYTLKLFNALKLKDRALSSSIPQNGKEVANLQEALTCLIKILSEDKRDLIFIYKLDKDDERILSKSWRVHTTLPEDIIVFAETEQEAITLAYRFISRGGDFNSKDLKSTEIRAEHIPGMDYLNFYGCSAFCLPSDIRGINLDSI